MVARYGSYSSRITHLLCIDQHSDVFNLAQKDQKRLVTAFWLNDCLLEKKMVPPWQALHLPLMYDSNSKPCTDQVIAMTNFVGEERHRVRQMISTLGARYTGYLAHSNTVLISKKPEGTKYERAKEWRIPVVNVSWLSDLLLGNLDALKLPVHSRYLQVLSHNELHMDMNRVHHLMLGWRSPVKINKEALKKMSAYKSRPTAPLSQENKQKSSDNSDIEESLAKRQKMEDCINGVTGYPRVLFTGFSPPVTKRLKSAVQQLGGVVVESARHCTHLVMPCLMRTMKFFVAISVCKYVLCKEWLEESLAQSKFLEEQKYFLHDAKGEMDLACSLKDTLTKAQGKPLFQNLTFFITPSVTPPPCDLKEIIDAAGGVVVKRRPPAKDIVSMVDEQHHPTFLVISCKNDFPVCRDIIDRKIALFDVEFILAGVTRQHIDFDTFKLTV